MRTLSGIAVAASLLATVVCAAAGPARPDGAARPLRSARASDSSAAYPLEIMLVLDRSGSMAGTPITDLKAAARTFVSYLASTQDRDKMGLVSFATSVIVNRPLGTDYVAPITTAINALTASGATNAEDAFDQADGPGGFTDQSGVPADQRARQALVFFSDGTPTAFRANFLRNSTAYDAVACVTGNCETGDNGTTYTDLGRPTTESWYGINPRPTGNGIGSFKCPGSTQTLPTTRWYAFDSDPVPGYDPTANCIPDPPLHDQICSLAGAMALQHAQTLKDAGVTIFTIGLGSRVNTAFMQQLASTSDLYYYAPTSAQLQAIFELVARSLQPPATLAQPETFGGLKARYRR